MFVQFAIVLFILCTLSWYLIRKNEHYFIVFIIILDFSLELILAKTFPSLVRISGRFTNVLLLSYLGYMVIKYRLNFF